jgi:hypothetical protein
MNRILLLAGLALALAGCDVTALSDSVDDFKVILDVDSQSTSVSGLVVDAETGELVARDVTVTFSSPTAGAVVDDFGDPVTGGEAEAGTFGFSVLDALAPTESAPVEVAVSVRAEGYLPQRRVIALADTGAYSLSIELFSSESDAEGLATASGSGEASAESGTAAPVEVTAAPATGGGASTVTVPQGTVFADASGRPLSGALDVSVVSFDPASSALDAVPALPGGAVALGGAVVSASVGGSAAASVGGDGVEVATTLPSADPSTGQPFASGDVVEALAYDAEAGAWVSAGQGVVRASAAPTGRLAGASVAGRFTTVGSYVAFVRADVPLQTVTVRVERNGNEGAVLAGVLGDGYAAARAIPSGRGQAVLQVPANAARLGAGVYYKGQLYRAADDLTCTDCVVTLPAAALPVTVRVAPVCEDPGKKVYLGTLPSFTVNVRERGTKQWFSLGTVADVERAEDGAIVRLSKTTTDLQAGATYDIVGRYLNETFEDSYAIPASGVIDETFEAPDSLCQ